MISSSGTRLHADPGERLQETVPDTACFMRAVRIEPAGNMPWIA